MNLYSKMTPVELIEATRKTAPDLLGWADFARALGDSLEAAILPTNMEYVSRGYHDGALKGLREGVNTLSEDLQLVRRNLEAKRTECVAVTAALNTVGREREALNVRIHSQDFALQELRRELHKVTKERDILEARVPKLPHRDDYMRRLEIAEYERDAYRQTLLNWGKKQLNSADETLASLIRIELRDASELRNHGAAERPGDQEARNYLAAVAKCGHSPDGDNSEKPGVPV